jgi:PAS domain-containing protein
MTGKQNDKIGDAPLRRRALSRLTGGGMPPAGRLDPSAAFKALYELALSPSTAPRALALLHELQVHQVELELQDEELRRSRGELEAALVRQAQLYDQAPAGLLTVDRRSVIIELNATAAHMFESAPDAVIGRPLDDFLAAESACALQTMLARLADGASSEFRALQLAMPNGALHGVCASASPDPAGVNYVIAMVGAGAGAG